MTSYTRFVQVLKDQKILQKSLKTPHSDTIILDYASMPLSVTPRIASVTRNTKETKIQLTLSLDGGPLNLLEDTPQFWGYESIPPQDSETHASQITASQHIWIWTGIGFLDHMLHAWVKHAGWSLRLRSRGDLMSLLSLSSHFFSFKILPKDYRHFNPETLV